jgi:hypothetical protein
VTCLNEQKRLFRAELARVRELRTQVEGPTAREAVASMIDEFEKKLHAVSDDAQLANVDLQNLLQQQQEVVQIMSNISKMLYDTAQAVIRKIGG